MGKIRDDIKDLKSKLRELRPTSTPGVVTSRTTRGISRRVKASLNAATSNTIPRWG